ncbi:MAG: phosphomannomutase/phosphoglucomutase [Gammaproteobacteria bacterium]
MGEGPVTNRRFSRRAVRKVALVTAAVTGVILIVVGSWYVYTTRVQSAAEESERQLADRAGTLAAKLAGPVAAVANQLKALSGEESIIQPFTQGDPDRLTAEAERRAGQIQSALKLRLLLPGQYGSDNAASPPLSFASLDLLKRAENSTAPIRAEVQMFGAPNQHIVMIQRVTDPTGKLIGLLHLSLDVALLERALSGLSPADGYIELLQGPTGKPLVLGNQGDAKWRTGDPVTAAVKGTRWSLAYWPASAAAKEVEAGSGGPGMAIAIVLIILAVGAVAAVFISRRPKRPAGAQQASEIVYAGAVQALMDGAHPGMERLVPNLPADRGQKAGAQPISQGMSGDDATLILNAEDLKAAAAETEVMDITREETPGAPGATAAAEENSAISPAIFRAYDIRGVAGKDLTADTVGKIGQSIGSEATARGEQGIIVGRDGRNSSPELAEALIQGLRASGRDVIDIGMVPTPVLYFATHFLEADSGVMLTGSHNPPEDNGLKIVLGGETLSEDAIQRIYNRIQENNLETGQGTLQSVDLVADYVRRISEDIPVALGGAFKIVVDCGNGVTGGLAPQLYRALGHDVIELYCDVDGNFPNHQPDPSQPGNLQDLIARVKEDQADLGFAFDGDGDRLGVIDGDGNIIWPDRQLMLLAKDVLSRNQGAEIIFDVKCSRYLKAIIEASGGKPLMWRTGHSLIKSKMKEVDAPLAGEMSGHIFFKERWYGFDDGLYAGARLLEVLMNAKASPAEVFAEMPEGVSTPELRVDLPEQAHRTFMSDLGDKMAFDGAEIADIDGYRVEFPDGWGLVRPSNTTPCLVLRFEADNEAVLERIQGEFRKLLLSINPDLQLPF